MLVLLVKVLVFMDRESGPRRSLALAAEVQNLDEIIECRPRLMDNVADKNPPSGERERFHYAQAVDAVSAFRIVLFNNAMHLAPVELSPSGQELVSKRLKMFAAPLDSFLTVCEPFSEFLGRHEADSALDRKMDQRGFVWVIFRSSGPVRSCRIGFGIGLDSLKASWGQSC